MCSQSFFKKQSPCVICFYEIENDRSAAASSKSIATRKWVVCSSSMFMEEKSTTNLPSYDAIFLKFWPILAYTMYAAQNEGLKLGENSAHSKIQKMM